MFLAPVSSWPEVSTHSVLIHLLPIFPSFFAIFCFTVGIVFNLTLHFPPQSTLAFYLSVKLLSLFPLVFISQLHGRAKYFSISVFDIQFPWTVFQDFLFFSSTQNSCKTRHIFKVAILRYNLCETPIINLPQAHEPVFHTCPTNLISALSLHTCLSHSLSDTYEIQQWEQRLPDFYWTQHTTKRHTGELNLLMYLPRLGCSGGNMTTWPLGRPAGTSVSFMTCWGEELVHLSQRRE